MTPPDRMTMIERVARAIFAARYGSPYEPMPWVTDAARAAIAAMREPTEGMIQAGMDKTNWPICNGEVEHRYQAMIDAALTEKPL